MIENFPWHYSMANPATLYDEESMTVLELVGRLSYKLRELIDGHNDVAKLSEQNRNQMDAIFDMVERLVVKPLGYATPQMFGAVGDGMADDTVSVQRALDALDGNAPVLYFPAGNYLVSADLVVPSNVTLRGQGQASMITRAPNALEHYAVLDMTLCTNVLLENLCIQGDKGGHTGTTGEWGMGIKLGSSYDITIRGVKVTHCWGDGIYVGNSDEDDMCGNITIENCYISQNRRNNISVIWVDGLRIVNCDILAVDGTAPQAGIDFEPNETHENINNTIVSGCRFNGNAGCDILIADGSSGHYFDITVTDCEFKSPAGFSYTGNLANATNSNENVVVRNCNFNNSFRCVKAVHGVLTNQLIFQGCNFKSNTMVVEIGSSDLNNQGCIGNVHFWDCSVISEGNNPIFRVLNSAGTCSNITGELNVVKSATKYFHVSVNDYQGSDISLRVNNAPTKVSGNATLSNTGMVNEIYIPDSVSTDPEITIGSKWPSGSKVVVHNYSGDMYATLDLNGKTFEVGSNKVATCVIKNGSWCVTT